MKNILDRIDLDTWIISDLHLGHGKGTKGILSFEPCRLEQMKKEGYTENDHNEWIITNWNSIVGEDDTVLLLGDFAFKQLINKKIIRDLYENYQFYSKKDITDVVKSFKNLELNMLKYYCHTNKNTILTTMEEFKTIIKKYSILEESDLSDRPEDLLNGNIILVIGNHDLKPLQYSNRNIDVVNGFYWGEGDLLSRIEHPDPMFSGFIKNIKSKDILFSHYPVFDNDEWDRKNLKIAPRINVLETIYKANKCDYNIHGHIHSKKSSFTDSINVSIEHINFKPIRLRELLSKI